MDTHKFINGLAVTITLPVLVVSLVNLIISALDKVL